MAPGKNQKNPIYPLKCDQIVDISSLLYLNMIKIVI